MDGNLSFNWMYDKAKQIPKPGQLPSAPYN